MSGTDEEIEDMWFNVNGGRCGRTEEQRLTEKKEQVGKGKTGII